MFGHTRTTKLKNDIRSLEDERDTIVDKNRKVKDELAELKQTKKMEDENIRHLVKIKEASLEIANEKKGVELERKQQEAIAKVKDEYRNKQESTLKAQIESGDKRFAEILSRLPNVQVKLKGDV